MSFRRFKPSKRLAAYNANPTSSNLDAFHDAQRDYGYLLRRRARPTKPDGSTDRARDGRWLITDFVTLGSPHAYFLLTLHLADFKDRIASNDYSVAPPLPEALDPANIAFAYTAHMPISPQAKPALLSFPFVPLGSAMMHWQMHHAAVFAATRWTNIYDPARFILCGDFISGPLKPLFG